MANPDYVLREIAAFTAPVDLTVIHLLGLDATHTLVWGFDASFNGQAYVMEHATPLVPTFGTPLALIGFSQLGTLSTNDITGCLLPGTATVVLAAGRGLFSGIQTLGIAWDGLLGLSIVGGSSSLNLPSGPPALTAASATRIFFAIGGSWDLHSCSAAVGDIASLAHGATFTGAVLQLWTMTTVKLACLLTGPRLQIVDITADVVTLPGFGTGGPTYLRQLDTPLTDFRGYKTGTFGGLVFETAVLSVDLVGSSVTEADTPMYDTTGGTRNVEVDGSDDGTLVVVLDAVANSASVIDFTIPRADDDIGIFGHPIAYPDQAARKIADKLLLINSSPSPTLWQIQPVTPPVGPAALAWGGVF